MIRPKSVCVVMMFLALVAIVGCHQPKYDLSELAEQEVPRPVELDRLDTFVGNWSGTSKIELACTDETITCKGTSSAKWDLDERFLIERAQMDMGDLGTMEGISLWTWDPGSKKYRTWWFDSWGGASTGTATYDEATKTWHMKGKGVDPWTGKGTAGKGTGTWTDENSMTWTYTEWDSWKLRKNMEMSGTSHRD